MENKIKQTYKLQEPRSTNYKRVISTSYSTSISRQKPLMLNNDIGHHLIVQSPNNKTQEDRKDDTQKQQQQQEESFSQMIGMMSQNFTDDARKNKNIKYGDQKQNDESQKLGLLNSKQFLDFHQKHTQVSTAVHGPRKQFNTQRGALDNKSQKSGQFEVHRPIFNNPLLNQTQDFISTQFGLQSSKQNILLPDVSQQTIPELDKFNQKMKNLKSQGAQRSVSKFKANNSNRQESDSIFQVQNNNGIQTFGLNSSIEDGFNTQKLRDFQHNKINALNRSFMMTGNNARRQRYKQQDIQNQFQSMELGSLSQQGRHQINRSKGSIETSFFQGENPLNQTTSTHQNLQMNMTGQILMTQTLSSQGKNSNQVTLLKNQRLKLIESIKRKSQPYQIDQQQDSQDIPNNKIFKQKFEKSQQHPRLSYNFGRLYNEFDTAGSKENNTQSLSNNKIYTQPQTQRDNQHESSMDDHQISESTNKLLQSYLAQEKKQKYLKKDNQSQEKLDANQKLSNLQLEKDDNSNSNIKQIIIKQKYQKCNEIGTQTGNGEYLQTLANQKNQSLKKTIDNLSKEVDIKEIDIEANSRLKTQDRAMVCRQRHKIYMQSMSSLANTLFDEQYSQVLGQKMTLIIKNQMNRLLNGLDQSFTQIHNYYVENFSRQDQQYNLFKTTLQQLTEQLKDTHIKLTKEKELNYEEYLKLDKEHPTRKAFELLGSLNLLLYDQNINQVQNPAPDLITSTLTSQTKEQDQVITQIGETYQNEADQILAEFDKIDKVKDAFERKMRKTQLLMQLQATDVTRTLKEVHQILLLKKDIGSMQAQTSVTMADQIKDEQRHFSALKDIEFEISQRFSNVQKLTAIKVLNRYYKPRRFKEAETQVDENNIYSKYQQKKYMIRDLTTQKEQIERQSQDLGRQLKIALEDSQRIKTIMKVQEIQLKDQEEKLIDLIKKEAFYKVKNDELSRKLAELDADCAKMKREREYLLQKIARRQEKMNKLQLEINQLTAQKNENERLMKNKIDMLTENYKVMSDAYVKERKEKETLKVQNTELENQVGVLTSPKRGDSQLEGNSQMTSQRHQTNQSYANNDDRLRGTHVSKSESPKKGNMNGLKQRSRANDSKSGGGGDENEYENSDEERRAKGKNSSKIKGKEKNSQMGRNNGSTNKGGNHKGTKNKEGLEDIFDEDRDFPGRERSLDESDSENKNESQEILSEQLKAKHGKMESNAHNKSVKFNNDPLMFSSNHKSMFNANGNSNDKLIDDDEDEDDLSSARKAKKHRSRIEYDFKYADYMKPIKQKSSSKQVTQFDDLSYHLLHNEKCGPNCSHLNRLGRSPNKNNRQLLPLKKQKLELDD